MFPFPAFDDDFFNQIVDAMFPRPHAAAIREARAVLLSESIRSGHSHEKSESPKRNEDDVSIAENLPLLQQYSDLIDAYYAALRRCT